MTSTTKTNAANLFSPENIDVDNVKFFWGRSRSVNAEDLASELSKADDQVKFGTARRTVELDAHLETVQVL